MTNTEQTKEAVTIINGEQEKCPASQSCGDSYANGQFVHGPSPVCPQQNAFFNSELQHTRYNASVHQYGNSYGQFDPTQINHQQPQQNNQSFSSQPLHAPISSSIQPQHLQTVRSNSFEAVGTPPSPSIVQGFNNNASFAQGQLMQQSLSMNSDSLQNLPMIRQDSLEQSKAGYVTPQGLGPLSINGSASFSGQSQSAGAPHSLNSGPSQMLERANSDEEHHYNGNSPTSTSSCSPPLDTRTPSVRREHPDRESEKQLEYTKYLTAECQRARCTDPKLNGNPIYHWLLETLEGRSYIIAYKQEVDMNLPDGRGEFKRQKLLESIIWREFNTFGFDISTERFRELAGWLHDIFKRYKALFFFITGGKDSLDDNNGPRGALYELYKKIREYLRCLRIMTDEKKKRIAPVEDVPDCRDFLIVVKNTREITLQFFSDWSATRCRRQIDFKRLKLNEIFLQYNPLRDPLGFALLEQDFVQDYGSSRSQSLAKNWLRVSEEIVHFARKINTVDMTGELKLLPFSVHSADTPSYLLQIVALFLLPFLLGPYTCVLASRKDAPLEKQRKGWTASIEEISNSFILHIKQPLTNSGNYDALVDAKEKELAELYVSRKLDVLPHLVVCGPLYDVACTYIIVGEHRWKVEGPDSPVECVDKCFKSGIALRKGFCKAALLV